MSATTSVALSHRAVNQAVSELCCADNDLSELQAAKLIANASHAYVCALVGPEAAAQALRERADALDSSR